MMEKLGVDDENFKFDFEEDIGTSTPDDEYVFKMVDDADNFDNIVVEDDSESDQDEPFHYSSKDSEDFPTFTELFRTHNEDDLRRRVEERVRDEGLPRTLTREELREERKKWFKPMPEERKFKRPLKFFMRHQDQSLGYILSWGYLEDLKVYAIKREFGVQYFKFLKDIKTLPWWDVEELVKSKNIQQCLWGPEVRCHEQRFWGYIREQAEANFPVWKPHYLKRVVKIDLVTGEKDITLHNKHPLCMKNMPLKEMEGSSRGDRMWLANCSKKDIECLFFNKIVYYLANKEQTLQFQKLIDACFEKNINSGHYWKSNWRDLERIELLKEECHKERMNQNMPEAAHRAKLRTQTHPLDTDQTPILSKERMIFRMTKFFDTCKETREWWMSKGRFERREKQVQREEKRRQKQKEKRRYGKA
ncbi:hypothetical protein Hanom_Chr12g01124611 [Helianthus anomalus]